MRRTLKRTERQRPFSKGAFPRHTGRTKGGLNSKLHAMCDDQGRPVRLHLTAGQVSDVAARAKHHTTHHIRSCGSQGVFCFTELDPYGA